MPVDEAGIDRLCPRIIGLLGAVAVQDLLLRAQLQDAPVLDRHRSVFMAIAVHAHDMGIAYHKIDLFVLVGAGG